MSSLEQGQRQLELARIYNDFKMEKLRQYKIQMPQATNKKIKKHILKEWNQYTLNSLGMSTNLAIKPTPNKVPNAMEIDSTNSKKNDGKSPKEQVPMEESQRQEVSMKTKGIKKPNNENYSSFYKRHYSKYKKEHPRWTKKQISIIIKLLWKNHIKQTRSTTSKIDFGPTDNKNMTNPKKMPPFLAFKTSDPSHTREDWNRLPFESKRLWQGKQDAQMMDQDQTIRLPRISNGLQFMNWT